ncbi:uncharacterized protein LOC144204696 isoform X2 [Stigmatopora nigra]
MGWWNTVKQWEELSSDEESKEQDDSRSFATLANKVNRGLPVFNKVFTGRAEVLWQHVVKLHALAGHLATFHQKGKVAGVTAIAGLALAPFTFGASRIATAGGVRSASASISDNVNNIQERKKTLNKCHIHFCRPLMPHLDNNASRLKMSSHDTDSLMGWWNTVKQWEELSSDEESKEQDDSRSFATLANKVNRGLPVFNKVFTGRAEVLWQHVVKLHALAGHLATFHQKGKVAGVTAIAGLALAPFTFGASRIATAGGVRSASASISDNVNNIQERKKTLNKCHIHFCRPLMPHLDNNASRLKMSSHV